MRSWSKQTRMAAWLAILVFFIGFIMLITMQVKLFLQKNELNRLNRSIAGMNARVNNLERCIEDCHDLDEISRRAEALGLKEMEDSQHRVVSLSGTGVSVAKAADTQ